MKKMAAAAVPSVIFFVFPGFKKNIFAFFVQFWAFLLILHDFEHFSPAYFVC